MKPLTRRFMRGSLCALTLALLLTGCKVTAPTDEALQEAWDQARSDLEEGGEVPDLSKRHDYQVLNSREEVLYTIADADRVDALDDLLGNEETEWQDNPSGGEIACIYVYRQEKTLLAGEDPDGEREYEELVRFTVYQDRDLITVKILGGLEDVERLSGLDLEDLLTFTVSVPAETMEKLRDPARFAG